MKDLGMETLFENDDFLVLNKLPEVVVQGSYGHSVSLQHHLDFLQEENNDNRTYKPVHRLDKGTSGALIIGKSKKAITELGRQTHSREIKKIYYAIVIGEFNEEREIVLKLSRNTDEESRRKVIVSEEGKETTTICTPVKQIDIQGMKCTYVKLDLRTGFMHQIRVHLSHIGFPIVGDPLYGNEDINRKLKFDHQLLHAYSVEFDYENRNYLIECEIPEKIGLLVG